MSKPLPKVEHPTHPITLPCSGKTHRYRPMLVREQRVLMTALETSKTQTGMDALRTDAHALASVVGSCLGLTPEEVRTLPEVDLTYAFVKLRVQSIGETAEPIVVCPHCKLDNRVKVDLSKVTTTKKSKVSHIVQLTPTVGIKLKLPGFIEMLDDKLVGISDINNPSPTEGLKVVSGYIESIFQGEDVFLASEYTSEELLAFIDGFTEDNMDEIQKFVESVPKLTYDVVYTCKNKDCAKSNALTLGELRDFF